MNGCKFCGGDLEINDDGTEVCLDCFQNQHQLKNRNLLLTAELSGASPYELAKMRTNMRLQNK